VITEKDLLSKVEKQPGVYFFSRKFGSVCKPFYIEETVNIRTRLATHWRSDAIKSVLRGLEGLGGTESLRTRLGSEALCSVITHGERMAARRRHYQAQFILKADIIYTEG
jgi:hypothetical protein